MKTTSMEGFKERVNIKETFPRLQLCTRQDKFTFD